MKMQKDYELAKDKSQKQKDQLNFVKKASQQEQDAKRRQEAKQGTHDINEMK